MILLQAKLLQRVRHKPIWALLILILFVIFLDKTTATTESEQQASTTTTPEPDAAPGCKVPDIRFNVIKPETTTTRPYAKFETTQIYLPEDFTTSDVEFVEKINIDLTGRQASDIRLGSADVNPYQVDIGEHAGAAAALTAHLEDEDTDIDDLVGVHDEHEDIESDAEETTRRRQNQQNRKPSKKRRSGSGRRRRLENENGQSRGRGGRYRRQAKIHHDPEPSPELDQWEGKKLAAEGDIYYVHIEDILKSRAMSPEFRAKLHKLRNGKKRKGKNAEKCSDSDSKKDTCVDKNMKKQKTKKATSDESKKSMAKHETKGKAKSNDALLASHHRRRGDSHEDKHSPMHAHGLEKRGLYDNKWQQNDIDKDIDENTLNPGDGNNDELYAVAKDTDGDLISSPTSLQAEAQLEIYENASDANVGDGAVVGGDGSSLFQRVKRKSGKTTGALSRPKGGGDSGSKTTSRKDKGESKGVFDEEGYSPVHPDEGDEDEEDEEEGDIDVHTQFAEVAEVRFPGEIGPLGDRRLCKIRCLKGKWVGPLCATNEEDDNGNVRFQPLYKSCHVNRIPPYLLLSYRNISVTIIRGSRRNRTSKSNFVSNTQINVGWDLPHGHSLQARCKDLGLYKLLGESRVLCSNGLWAPRMPSCVPTTLLTNFSDDSAPSIRIKVLNGSGAFEPSGVLAVLPHSAIILDCIYPRQRGQPDWSWTSWYQKYPTGWSTAHEEKNLRYRLTIKDIDGSDSGTFTCTSPRGLTNSVTIVVATATCPQLPEPVPPLTLRLEGIKLGQRAMYRCPPGYRIDGVANATCLASGNWSSPPPTCQAVQCPRLILDDSHLSLVELNTSAWGRAVFKCQWGFKLTGPPGLECLPTGFWSGPVPRCKAIQCPMPVAPLNGRIGGTNFNERRLTVGALVTFSCNEGHTLVGEASIICTETGFWSHSPPFCKSQCPYPGDPPNGLIAPLKFNYDSGDYLSVQCRPGFVQYSENGPPERPKCQPDGNWSGPVPKCRSYEEV